MLKRWNDETKKKYLLGAVILFSVVFVISLALVFGLSSLGTTDFSLIKKIGISVLCALLPTGSYTGFCLIFISIKELSSKQLILTVVFCVPLVIYACVYGTIMLFPVIFSCLVKNNS